GSFWIVVKSSVPLLLAILLKIVLWDYALAIKSALFTASFRHSLTTLPPEKQPKGLRRPILIGLVILGDLFISGLLTGAFFYYAEHYQALHIDPAVASSSAFPKSVRAFFDEVSFAAKDALENSFYVLNGSLMFYLSFGAAWLIDRLKGKVDETQLQKNIFKVIAAFASLIILVSVISFKLADH
ncbi:MAG TPA: hypothetical protein VK178_09875, partial [Opitutaceae bacterium]|nr:hypothetical protein [Opitutaceae bacterium]